MYSKRIKNTGKSKALNPFFCGDRLLQALSLIILCLNVVIQGTITGQSTGLFLFKLENCHRASLRVGFFDCFILVSAVKQCSLPLPCRFLHQAGAVDPAERCEVWGGRFLQAAGRSCWQQPGSQSRGRSHEEQPGESTAPSSPGCWEMLDLESSAA